MTSFCFADDTVVLNKPETFREEEIVERDRPYYLTDQIKTVNMSTVQLMKLSVKCSGLSPIVHYQFEVTILTSIRKVPNSNISLLLSYLLSALPCQDTH